MTNDIVSILKSGGLVDRYNTLRFDEGGSSDSSPSSSSPSDSSPSPSDSSPSPSESSPSPSESSPSESPSPSDGGGTTSAMSGGFGSTPSYSDYSTDSSPSYESSASRGFGSAPSPSPAPTLSDAEIMDLIESMSPPVGAPPSSAEMNRSIIESIIDSGTVRDASGNAMVDSFNNPILTGEAAEMVASGRAHFDTIIGSPTYHQWVEGPSRNGTPGSEGKNFSWTYGTAVNGMTMEQLQELSEEGKGSMDISDTQTVDQAIASLYADRALTQYIAPAFTAYVTSAIPGSALALQGVRMLSDVMAGKATVGNAITNVLIGLGASKLGISPGTATAILNMDWGKAIATEGMRPVISEITGKIAEATGLPRSAVSAGLAKTGVAKDVSSAISDYINDLIPGSATNNVGVASGIIDSILGTNVTSGAINSGALPSFDASGNYTTPSGSSSASPAPAGTPAPAGAPAPAGTPTPAGTSSSSAPWWYPSGTPATNSSGLDASAVLALLGGMGGSRAAAAAPAPVQESTSGIQLMEDIFGPTLTFGKPAVKTAKAAHGGSVDELLQILRG